MAVGRQDFDPGEVPLSFWQRADIRQALADRDVAVVFRLLLQSFPWCTQTRLALLIAHDRSEVSNWVRGVRRGQVSDIGVLTRIADGLQLPDEARRALGLASVIPERQRRRGARMAICGSRAPGTNASVIDEVVPCLARLLATEGYHLGHGPVGIGMEVITYAADRYGLPGHDAAIGKFGHRNVVHGVSLVVVVGGGSGTEAEIDIALAMKERVIAVAASGGTAKRFYTRASMDPALRAWVSDSQFAQLGEPEPGPRLPAIIKQLMEIAT